MILTKSNKWGEEIWFLFKGPLIHFQIFLISIPRLREKGEIGIEIG